MLPEKEEPPGAMEKMAEALYGEVVEVARAGAKDPREDGLGENVSGVPDGARVLFRCRPGEGRLFCASNRCGASAAPRRRVGRRAPGWAISEALQLDSRAGYSFGSCPFSLARRI